MRGNRGFQLLEMLIVISIISLVVSMSAPHITNLYQEYLAYQVAHRLRDSMNSARLEALQRRVDVVVCPLQYNTCHTNWQAGWSLFVDSDGNKQPDINEPITKQYLGNSVIRLAFRNRIYRYIAFAPTGTANFTSIYVCGAIVAHGYYRVVINRSGRTRVEPDDTNICQSSSST